MGQTITLASLSTVFCSRRLREPSADSTGRNPTQPLREHRSHWRLRATFRGYTALTQEDDLHDQIVEFVYAVTPWSIEPTRKRTREACLHVLLRLPEDIRSAILSEPPPVIVIAPADACLALTRLHEVLAPLRDLSTEARTLTACSDARVQFAVVYLSPFLEQQPLPVIVGTVAHELAHAITKNVLADAERHMDNVAIQWGFGEEIKSLRQVFPVSNRQLTWISRT